MPDTPLPDLLAALLPPAGWEPLPDGDGWRRDAHLDTGADTPLPVALALVPLGDGHEAPLVFTATVPAPVGPHRRAGALLAAVSAERVPVGTVEISGHHVRYRLAHDPAVAPHTAATAQGLLAAGTGWAAATLPNALFALTAAGMTPGRRPPHSDKFVYTSPDQIHIPPKGI